MIEKLNEYKDLITIGWGDDIGQTSLIRHLNEMIEVVNQLEERIEKLESGSREEGMVGS